MLSGRGSLVFLYATFLGKVREKCPCKHQERTEGKQNEGEIVRTKDETVQLLHTYKRLAPWCL